MTEPHTSSGFHGTQVQRGRRGLEVATEHLGLSVQAGPDRGKGCEVTGPRLTIGSAQENDLQLEDPTVSRHHCELRASRKGYVLRDLGSRNGTLVGSTLVREAVLLPGAVFHVGDDAISFEPRRRWEPVAPCEETRFGDLIGTTETMRSIFALLERVAHHELSCLLVGETGTGKELAARALHQRSPRADRPFVVFDCSAASATLVESELFGHERGAFTDARERRAGAFERAHGGTLFLDEIGELPSEMQPKLLRALDRGEIRRLGGDGHFEVDVRIIAATNRDLLAEDFRTDLYHRIAEVVVELPPLRSRVADIPPLAESILEAMAGQGRAPPLDTSAVQWLMRQPWPGNVRQLRNQLRRAAALRGGETVTADDLEATGAAGRSHTDAPEPADLSELSLREAREQWLVPMERKYLERLLDRYGGDVDRAASHAGVHRKSLLRLLKRHGVERS